MRVVDHKCLAVLPACAHHEVVAHGRHTRLGGEVAQRTVADGVDKYEHDYENDDERDSGAPSTTEDPPATTAPSGGGRCRERGRRRRRWEGWRGCLHDREPYGAGVDVAIG